jgi:competence protein ComEC
VTRPPVSTPAGWRLVGACALVSAAVALGFALRPAAMLVVVVGAVAAAIVCALGVRRSPHALVAALVGACCIAGLCRGALATPTGTLILDATRGSPATLVGTVREGTGSRRSSAQVVIDVDRIVGGDVDRSLHAGVLATLRAGPAVLPGDRVQLDVAGLRSPGSVGAESILAREGVDAVAQSPTLTVRAHGGPSVQRTLAVVRARLAAAVDGALPEPAAALLDGIVFGIPRPLPADLTASLRDSGLAHILAVSGLKVVLVAGLVAALCRALAASPRARLLATAPVVGGYVVLCGAGPAAVRSAIMAGAGWSLYGTGRAADPLPLLAAVAAAMLLADPGLSRDVGFQLSVLGTLGIVLLTGRVARRLPGPRLLCEPFAMALSAQALTLPVMAGTFGVISLVGPLANAIAVPLLPPLIAVALIGTALSVGVPAAGIVLLHVAGLLVLCVAGIARVAANLPAAAIHVAAWPPALVLGELVAVATAALVWTAARRRRRSAAGLPLSLAPIPPQRRPNVDHAHRPRPPRRVPRSIALGAAALAAGLAGCAAVLAASRPDGRLHVAVLDVGGAVAVAVQTRDGGHALVDTGTDPQRLLQSLGAALPPLTHRLDLVVLTGGDRGAVGALPGLTDRYGIDRVVAPADGLAGAARAALDGLRRTGGEVDLVPPDSGWTWGGAAWRLPSPDGTAQAGEALDVADPTGTVLILGALAVDAQEQLAALHGGGMPADLLVAPASGAVAPTLLDAVRARLVAVPTGGRGARSTTAPLLSGPGVRHTGDAGTLTYTGSDGGLVAT